jgi:hypothetical protein
MNTNQDNAWEQVGIAAALAQTYARDQGQFLPALTGLLEAALPDQTTVERKPVRLFSSEKRVTELRVTLGEDIYTLSPGNGGKGLEAKRIKIVRGIALKTETLDLETWLSVLGGTLQARAKQNEAAFFALQNFMEIKRM